MSDPTDLKDESLLRIKSALDDAGDPWQRLCRAVCIFLSELITCELEERAVRKKGKGKG